MKILLIEDNNNKAEQIQKFVRQEFSNCEITLRQSYISGKKEIVRNYENYDLILLDISMQNYDIDEQESGGDPIPLAGKLILGDMYMREIPTKTIVITMYESYVDGTKLKELHNSLLHDFPYNYIGFVHFNMINESSWKEELKSKIDNFIKNNDKDINS